MSKNFRNAGKCYKDRKSNLMMRQRMRERRQTIPCLLVTVSLGRQHWKQVLEGKKLSPAFGKQNLPKRLRVPRNKTWLEPCTERGVGELRAGDRDRQGRPQNSEGNPHL